MQHLLNECILTKSDQSKRHNKILATIELHLQSQHYYVYREKRIHYTDQASNENKYLIPDLLVVSRESNTVMCFDVGVSYEHRADSLDKYDQAKRSKYSTIANDIIKWLHQHGHLHVNKLIVNGLIFGSRGAIHNVCLNILLNKFRMTKSSMSKLLTDCAMDSHDMIVKYRSWTPALPDQI